MSESLWWVVTNRACFPYLPHQLKTLLIHPKHLDSKDFTILVLSLPNIRETTWGDGSWAFREDRFDFMGIWKYSVHSARLPQGSDASPADIGFWRKDLYHLREPAVGESGRGWGNGEQTLSKPSTNDSGSIPPSAWHNLLTQSV